MRAADEGVPPRTATAVVEVNIQRDEGELKFTAQNYAARVEENKEVGQTVTNVRAAPGVSQVVSLQYFGTLCRTPTFSNINRNIYFGYPSVNNSIYHFDIHIASPLAF